MSWNDDQTSKKPGKPINGASRNAKKLVGVDTTKKK